MAKPGMQKSVGSGHGSVWLRGWTAARFPGKLRVGIGGKLYPQVGRVCMDQIVVDLGDNEYGVQQGDEAIIFGWAA